ncbi:MAG: muramoyltetrapeptide carboxypeptidase [Oxalobacter sp.]|nr:MAG: muramoyltetrapeptide carboxypeptidase [Oxalobacter sp.]
MNTASKIGVAIVAPGGYAQDAAAYGAALALMEKQGFIIHSYYNPETKHFRFSDTDDVRAEQLHRAASNPEVQVVMALRGGYGMSRLLPLLDFDFLAKSGKLFVGHSDFTAFQLALLAKTGAMSFAGPMICDDYTVERGSDATRADFLRCISSPTHTVSWPGKGNPSICVSGQLWGGNLSMLTSLLGTPWFPQIEDGILFVEDVNEHPYRIERMMLQLLRAGVFEQQKALVLGDFSGYRLNEYDNGYDFDVMLDYLRQHLPMPVLTGLPFGHMKEKATLAVGCDAQLDSLGELVLLGMMRYPVLQEKT